MFCTKCGAQLPEGVKFCTSCGAPVKTIAAAQAPVEQASDTFVPVYAPEAPAAPVEAKKKKKVWPIVLTVALIALIAAAVCAVLFVPAVHDMVFGVEELSFAEGKLELPVGDKLDLTDELDAGKRDASDLNWSSDDENVATVKNGVVTAVGVGECRITVEDKEHDDVSDELRVTVYEKVLRFEEDEITLKVGETAELKLVTEHINSETTMDVSNSDTNVASLDGWTVTALSAGQTIITVKGDGKEASVTVTVEAEAPSPEPVDVAAAVAQIRSWYYTPGSGDVRREVAAGAGGWNYGREYLFHDGQLVFAFVHDGNDQNRLYFQDGKLIFVIAPDRTELSGDAVAPYQGMADQAKSDSLNYAP